MTLDEWQDALSAEVTGHYNGWLNDFAGDDGNGELRGDVDQAFAAARAHWQLGTDATQPDTALRELILRELNEGPVAFWSAKAMRAEVFWNPCVESYEAFRGRYVNVEPFVACKPHDLRQMFAMYAFKVG